MYRTNPKFISPLLRKPSNSTLNIARPQEPPAKRIKLEDRENVPAVDEEDFVPNSDDEGTTDKDKPEKQQTIAVPLKSKFVPLKPVTTTTNHAKGNLEGYYNALWRKPTAKKHKTWEGDAILVCTKEGFATLQDLNGKDLAKGRISKRPELGDIISVGGKEVEIDSNLSKEDFLAGRPFMKTQKNVETEENLVINPTSFYVQKQFKTPLLASTIYKKTTKDGVPIPRHDPNAEGALVMKRPPEQKGKQIVDVVVDPFITNQLRPHQREGVSFMYETVMGLRAYEGNGAILADEMGLGKTLQTIALLWTLLKQNPIYEEKPVIQKALIVCPVTLINNWKKEFRKWLGAERIGVFLADGKSNLRDFTHGMQYSVAIVGYERLRNIQNDLAKAKIDIIIADEGHRLKTANNKSAQAIKALNTPRRIILSGTPLQNDLSELFFMVNFVNPGVFENYNTFKKEFENPILKSRQPGASKKDKEKGIARGETLAALTKLFVLRRTANVLSKYLPPKTEFVVYCTPSPMQLELYKAVLESPAFDKLMRKPECSLQLITLLKKLCNSPVLLSAQKSDEDSGIKAILEDHQVTKLRNNDSASSGKLKVLDRMLKVLRERTAEKIVIVSNYTTTLDVLQNLCIARSHTFLRLDGKTPTNKRQDLVDKFNRVDAKDAFVFLLSTKAGGVGINLIGASRLVLFDSDWNPANDLQSMARVHRQGQKSPVFIYRLLTTGCLDEKIYQRQITKQGLADSIMDKKAGGSTFTQSELRDLFTLVTDTDCNTHDLLGCPCKGEGEIMAADNDDDEDKTSLNSDNDEDILELPKLMPASQIDVEEIERKLAASKDRTKGGMKALLEYAHIKTANLLKDGEGQTSQEKSNDRLDTDSDMEALVNDDVLRRVIGKSGASRISFLFSKMSQAEL